MPRSRKARPLIGLSLLAIVALAILAAILSSPVPTSSSTTPRMDQETWEKGPSRFQPNADQSLPSPAIIYQAKESPAGSLSIDLPGQASIEVIAFALSVPGQANQNLPLRFRHPLTLDPLSQISDNLPPAATAPFSVRNRPVITLILKGSDHLPYLHPILVDASDTRTRFPVATNFQTRSFTGFTQLNIELGIWHDTPLLIELVLGHGPPEIIPIDPHLNREYTFGEVTLRVLTSGQRHSYHSLGQRLPWAWIDHDPPLKKSHGIFLKQQGDSFGEVSWIDNSLEGRREVWGLEAINSDVQLSAIFLPQSLFAKFTLPALPDMPNPREVQNLFEIKIPEITLDSMAIEAPILIANAIEFNHFPVTPASPTHFEERPEPYLPGTRPSNSLPPNNTTTNQTLTLTNVTPAQLMHSYHEAHPDARIMIDPENFTLRVEHRETLPQKIQDWWLRNAPSWLK